MTLSEMSIKLHEKNKEIRTHTADKLLPARGLYKTADAQLDIDMAKERLKAKAYDLKITETNAKNTAVKLLEEQKLALVVLESAYEKEVKEYDMLKAEFDAIEIESNNVRAEVKRFGG